MTAALLLILAAHVARDDRDSAQTVFAAQKSTDKLDVKCNIEHASRMFGWANGAMAPQSHLHVKLRLPGVTTTIKWQSMRDGKLG